MNYQNTESKIVMFLLRKKIREMYQEINYTLEKHSHQEAGKNVDQQMVIKLKINGEIASDSKTTKQKSLFFLNSGKR